MKKVFTTIILVTLSYMLLATSAYAISPTPTPSPASSSPTDEAKNDKLMQQIDQLKDKIASKVAELKLVEKRGVIGTVTDTTNNQITLTDLDNQTQFVDVDEITKFSSPDSKGTFGISDLTKGMIVTVLGTYNKDSKRILARFVTEITMPRYITGEITDISKADYTISVTDENKKTWLTDIENVTKMYDVDTDGNMKKSGFSKFSLGDRVLVVGYANKKDSSRTTATRVLDFAALPKDPKISLPASAQVTETPQVLPTVKSTRKVVPAQ